MNGIAATAGNQMISLTRCCEPPRCDRSYSYQSPAPRSVFNHSLGQCPVQHQACTLLLGKVNQPIPPKILPALPGISQYNIACGLVSLNCRR